MTDDDDHDDGDDGHAEDDDDDDDDDYGDGDGDDHGDDANIHRVCSQLIESEPPSISFSLAAMVPITGPGKGAGKGSWQPVRGGPPDNRRDTKPGGSQHKIPQVQPGSPQYLSFFSGFQRFSQGFL